MRHRTPLEPKAVRDWTAATSHIPCSMANVVVGIIGSSLGRFIGARIGKDANTDTAGWAISAEGAALLIFILKMPGIYS